MLFSLENFKTEVARRNLARPTRFEALIPTPLALRSAFSTEESRIISLFCESTAFPPQIIGVRQQRIYGPLYPRPFGIEYGGEGLPMSFYLDQQMDVKAFFDAWMSKIVDLRQYFVYYPIEYSVNLTLHQLNERNSSTYSVTIEDAFPRSVTLIELNHGNQNQISRLNVVFTFRRWRASHPTLDKMKYPDVKIKEPEAAQVFIPNSRQPTSSPIKPTSGFEPKDGKTPGERLMGRSIDFTN